MEKYILAPKLFASKNLAQKNPHQNGLNSQHFINKYSIKAKVRKLVFLFF